MPSFPRSNYPAPPRGATSRPPAGRVSPAALRIAQEADATMSPDGWEADYAAPGFRAEVPAGRVVFSLREALVDS